MFTASDQMFQCPPRPLPMDKKWKPKIEIAPNCPRCASPNTKFCYYNNYSLSQPRYFCKGCRRYWTKGGSLRNVPVGGGCRRNRRAKSVRLAQNERVSMNYSKYLNTFVVNPNESLENASSSNEDIHMLPPSDTNGSDIDLAVVFAKFLNQNSSLEPEFVNQELPNEANTLLIDVSNSLTLDSDQNDAMIECQELSQVLVGEKQQEEEEEKTQEFMESDVNAFGLQSLLSDEVVQDVLWSDDVAATMTNFTWQPMVQLPEFDSLPVDHDQLRNSTNLVSDNWSSFDLSGFEVFSRP